MPLSRRGFVGGCVSSLAAAQTPSRGSDDDPLGVRKDFPALRESTFLNTAYIGLIPQRVADAAREFTEMRSQGKCNVGRMLAKTEEARKLFAGMVGASADEIGFLFSTSEGENVVVNSLDFKPGDNVVFDDIVYPSTPVIYRRLQQTHGVEMRVVKSQSGGVTVEDFAKLVDGRTRMVSVAWVSNVSGHRHDMKALADLAHSHGAYLYSDAIQFIGTAPVDVRALGVDFFTTGTYKWLMAGFGVAPFYVRRELMDRIHPASVGWMVAETLPNFEYRHHKTAEKFEYASPAFGQLYELTAALTYLERVGLDRIQAQSQVLVRQLRSGLKDRGFDVLASAENGSSIVSFHAKKPLREIQELLDRERVKVSLHADDEASPVRVRVAAAFFNNDADIKRFLTVSERMA